MGGGGGVGASAKPEVLYGLGPEPGSSREAWGGGGGCRARLRALEALGFIMLSCDI